MWCFTYLYRLHFAGFALAFCLLSKTNVDEISSKPNEMDKILAPIKQRILQFIDFKGFDKGKFFSELGVAASNFRSKSLYSEVGAELVAKISSVYPELNLYWLINGSGEMIIDVYSRAPEPRAKKQENNTVSDEVVFYSLKLAETQTELIKMQREKIISLQEELDNERKT